jgi:hypothetical protein
MDYIEELERKERIERILDNLDYWEANPDYADETVSAYFWELETKFKYSEEYISSKYPNLWSRFSPEAEYL